MAVSVRLINPNTMSHAVAYEGFSWTCLFFGPFPALVRGDLLGCVVMFPLAFLTAGFSGLVFMFIYNGWHYNRLLARGYQPLFGSVFVPATSQTNVVNVNVGDSVYSKPTATFVAKAPRTPQIANRQEPARVSFGQRR